MDHEMMAGPSGTFVGHLIPGIAFTIWGLWWLAESLLTPRVPGEAVERSIVPSSLKIIAVVIALPLEMPNSGWDPMDWVMGWHHITGYAAIALSGVVDFAARRGRLTKEATYPALAAAMFVGAILFFGHGNAPGVEGTAHSILTLSFVSVGIFAIVEAALPGRGLEWFRTGAMIALGCWLSITAWILFRSGWDMADHAREGQVWLALVWMLMVVAIGVTTAKALRTRPA